MHPRKLERNLVPRQPSFRNLVRFLSCELGFCKSTYFESFAKLTLHHENRCGKTSGLSLDHD